ncbi:MAG TPA: hypothetical protein VK395_34885 [Gemmataceae bacterium]|nr:hypothetical protein [Gemmataceae bacterium]
MSECRYNRITGSNCLVFAILSGLCLAGAVRADDPDKELLDQVRRREKVAAQKLESELRQTLIDAQRLVRYNPSKAIQRLKDALAQLEDDTALPQDRRMSLKRMVKDQIRVAEAEQANTFNPDGTRIQRADRRRPADTPSGDRDKINERLKAIQELQNDGKTEQARRAADELANRHPGDPSVQAAERAASAIDQVNAARKLLKNREKALVGSNLDMDQSSMPPRGDMEFPKNFAEKTKNRSTGVKLTVKEQAILSALNSTISVNFKNSKLEDAIQHFQMVTKQPIILDQEALKDVDASYDSPVTLSVQGISVRTALRKILAEVGMTYVIKNESIQVTSAQRARESMVTRAYYIGDILAGMAAPLGLPVQPGLTALQQFQQAQQLRQDQQLQATQSAEAAKQIIEMITSTTDPQSWRANGGIGTVVYHSATQSLIINQSAEIHALLGGGGLLK